MKRTLLLLLFINLIIVLSALRLTPDEEAWLQSHPVVKLGIGESWAPFVNLNEDGAISGFDVDWASEVSNVLGIKLEIVPGRWHEIVSRAEKREIDGLVESAVTVGRSNFFNFTEPYNVQYYALATTPNEISKIRSEDDLKGKTLAFLKGNVWIDKIIESLPELNRIEVDSETEAFKLVMEGKADASFLTIAMFSELQKIYRNNIKIAHVFESQKYRLDLVYSIRKDWPEFIPILNKAFDSIGESRKNIIFRKWFGVVKEDFQTWITLNEEEITWLKNHPVIRIAPDPDFPPIEWLDENGKYIGITADYMELISQQLNIDFQVVQCHSWEEVLKKARDREIDLLPAAAQTSERSEYMLFSSSYLEFPGVIITTKNNKHLGNSEKLIGKKVGIVAGYAWQEFIKSDYPQINIVEMQNTTEGLRKISTNEIDAIITTLPIALYYIEKDGISNLVVAGETEYKTQLSILTRKDWPILNSIINKSLEQIPRQKKQEIYEKWINLQSHSFWDNYLFWFIILSILALSGLFITFTIVWNKALQKQVKLKTLELEEDISRRERIEEDLAASEEKYKLLINNQLDLLVEIDADGRFLFVNPSYCNTFGKKEEELLGHTFMPMIHPDDLASTMEAMKKLKTPPYTCYLEQRSQTLQGWRWLAWMDKAILDNEGNISRIIGLGRDITKQKETELKISKIAREWETTFDASNDAFWILDKDNKIIRSNLTAAKMFDQKVSELIGGKCWDVVHNGDNHMEECPFEKCRISLKRESMELEVKTNWFRITVDPILNEKGEFNGAVHIISDVTEKKKLELELAAYRTNLEELVKERTAELVEKNEQLEQFNKLFIGREFRIKELKEKLKNLEK